MELNKDCIDILKYMKEKNDYVRIQELAEKYKVTDRAIRYKVDKIEEFLVKNGLGYLDKQHSKGVKLPNNKKVVDFINKFVGDYTPYKYVYSKDERIKFIIVKLLQSSKPITIGEFESKLCISKNTVLKELDEVEIWLESKDLELSRKPKVGVLIEGEEIKKRKALIEITSETVSSEALVNYISRRMIQSKINNLQFDILFSDIDIDFIDNIIRHAEVELNREFSDEAYGGLITHLAIMIKRIQLDKEIHLPDINNEVVKNTKEYEVSGNLIKRIEKHYGIKVPEVERSYIVIHLLGAKVLRDNEIYKDDQYKLNDLYGVVKAMTEEIEEIYTLDFGEDKEKLLDDLLLHLRPSLYRIKYGANLINPLFDEIKLNYRDLFSKVKMVAKHLEDYVGSTIDDHEISYIVIHYAAALRNYNQKHNKKARVVLVCGTGIGTAKIISSYICEKFKVDIVSTTASRNILSLDKSSYDYIITTVDIPDLREDEYIKISPLLLEKDYKSLEKYLAVNHKSKVNSEETYVVKRIMNIVDKYCDIRDREQLQYELMYELKRREEYTKIEEKTYVLKDFIKSDTIRLKANCKDWREAIHLGCEPLIEKGSIGEDYTKEIIKNLENIGPYMVIAPSICLAHGKLDKGIKGTSMSLLNLKYPVKFNNELNDPVKLIITFATDDDERHLNALSNLMELITNKDDVHTVMNSSSKEEIIELINKYSK